MESALIDHAIALLEDANADLQPELLPAPVAHRLLRAYARAEKLAGFGVAALARRIDEASALGRVTGTSVGKAKETIATSRAARCARSHFDDLVRPRHAALLPRTELDARPQASLLEVPSGQDDARSQGRRASAGRTLTWDPPLRTGNPTGGHAA